MSTAGKTSPGASNPVEMLLSVRNFADQSMTWCANESAKAASQVASVLDHIVADAERVANMNHSNIDVLKRMRERIQALADENSGVKVTKVISEMKDLAKEHIEVADVVTPLISVLQFQDRLQQNLQNLTRITDLWLQTRPQLDQAAELSDEQRRQFGELALALCTMKEERDVVRRHIDGLPEEEVGVEDVALF